MKKDASLLTWVTITRIFGVMPNQHDPAKRTLAVYLSREKYYKIKRLAAKHHISMSGLLEILIDRAVCDIELEPEDYEKIAKEIRDAKNRKKTDYRKAK